jgi:hypothetical protein
VLVNNAGILLMKPVHETSTAEWDRVFNVNVRGTFFGTRAVVPAMRQAGGGSIINISSVYGVLGARSAYAYEASKGAVRLFSKACAADLAPLHYPRQFGSPRRHRYADDQGSVERSGQSQGSARHHPARAGGPTAGSVGGGPVSGIR